MRVVARCGWLLLLMVCASAQVFGQGNAPLPDGFDDLIQMKTELLEQYGELQKTGPPQQAIDVLRQIVNIHRKALNVAIEIKQPDDIVSQLQRVYGNDTEYLSDQLFERSEYTESAALRREIEEFYERLLGADHSATNIMKWKAVAAEKLSKASRQQQAAYKVATAAEAQGRQAIEDGQLEVAAQVFDQLVTAQVAILGDNHPDVADDLNDYGRILWMQKNYDAAQGFYERSLQARESTSGKNIRYANTAFNLGRVYQDTNRFAKAEEFFLMGAAVEEELLGSTHESYLQTLQQLASVYRQSGEAEKLAALERKISAADPFAVVTDHLPTGTFAAAVVQPAKLVENPDLQLLPFEVIEAAGIQEVGFNPLEVETLLGFGTLPITNGPPNWGVLFRLKDGVSVQYPWLEGMEPTEFRGNEYLKAGGTGGEDICFVEFDDGVALIGTEETIRQSLTSAGETKLSAMLKADRDSGQLIAAVNLEVVRPIVQAALQETPPVPPQLENLKSIPGTTDTLQLHVNVADGMNARIVLNSPNEQTAQQNADAITQALDFGVQMALQEMQREMGGDDAVELAAQKYVKRLIEQYVQKFQPVVDGNSVVLEVSAMDNAVGPIAVALLLPAVQAAREAARRTQGMNDLKQIALAMHIHHDIHNSFPARASYDKNGKPLLSWRVHLLPYLDQEQLYEQFHLDEPWDSDHNKTLIEQMPQVYEHKSFPEPGKTLYVTPDGKGTVMEGTTGVHLRDITDGTSNTIMVVEANEDKAVVWTKPEDLPFDEEEAGDGLGDIRPQGFLAAFADGSVRVIPSYLDNETLRRLILKADGQIVDPF